MGTQVVCLIYTPETRGMRVHISGKPPIGRDPPGQYLDIALAAG